MERYSSYKDSGVQWLGEIPSHWEVVPFKNIANIILGKMLENAPEGQGDKYLCAKDVHMNSINYDDLKLMKFSPEEKKKYAIQKGDMLVVEGGASGSSAIVNKDVKNVYIQNSLMIVRCGENVAYNPFASYMLNSMVNRGYAESVCNKATIMHFTKEKLGATLIAFPPLPEQQAIAAYLDTVTSKIDIAISQQQKMIDLLNERKQIIINNAVTKGLNPNVKMKDSGVDWIGEIPEHWEMKRLKTILSVKDKRNVDPEALLLSVYTAIGVRPRQELEERGNKASTVINYKIVSKGDLIVNRLLAWMGAYGLSNYDGVTSPDYDVYSFHADVNRGYYETLFRNTQFKSDCYKYGHGIMMMRWRTYSDEFLSINVPIPPRQEQDAIFDYLKPQIDKIEEGVLHCNNMIFLLQERKQIIINEVVTGKVKVC